MDRGTGCTSLSALMYQTTSPASLSLATICSLSVYLQNHHNDNGETHAELIYARDARIIFPLNNKKRTPHEVHCKNQTKDELAVIIAAAKLCCMLRRKDDRRMSNAHVPLFSGDIFCKKARISGSRSSPYLRPTRHALQDKHNSKRTGKRTRHGEDHGDMIQYLSEM